MAYKIDASLGALNSSQSSSQLVRTSTGILYAVIISSGDVRVYKSSNQGISWSQQDFRNVRSTAGTVVAAAIDSTDKIHIIAANTATTIQYFTYSTLTDTYTGNKEKINPVGVPTSITSVGIAIDSNNIPHVAFSYPTSTVPRTDYSNRLKSNQQGGFWSSITGPTVNSTNVDIQVDNNNIPIFSVESSNAVNIYIGNKNSPTTLSASTTTASNTITNAGGTSLTIDASNNIWVAYQAINDNKVYITKHISTDAINTWQTPVTDNFNGKSVSLAADQNDIYIFYERNLGGIAYDRYDTTNGKWLGETILQPQTIGRDNLTPSFQPHNPFVKWSQYFNNGDTGANNSAQQTIEYLFDDGSTVYYDKLTTAQISTGLAQINFSTPVAATTTSTSSTSISSTSSSTSISTSTSSTSSSTSLSTSSTSSSTSTSTSSTSSSISTSSTSSSTSISTSSTSKSTSTSSTSSSISTSSTSSSLSTSSTSSSTSISTSSTSRSTSTSQSTSTSSTSMSTSLSTSSTSSSTSTSFSTSSTSSSTSTSRSTSTSSTSASTSISTSSTSSSTSTSSTSSSTSISISSTSSSTSISTSSTSTSTTASLTTSTSSTSTSTSTSRSTSTSSTSSSISTSLSTSSTSSSTSTSISTSSTSTSTSFSTSSTSTSTSFSTSSTSSSTSTSLSTSSTSSSTTVATTTSTSSTSSSTSTSTTVIDINFRPRSIIRPEPQSLNILDESVQTNLRRRLR